MNPSQLFDICIVGAGVGGSAMCSYLSKITEYKIAIIEQDWNKPDQIIGELLQPSGVSKLREMGLGEVFENIDAQKINGYAMFLNQESFNLPYTNKEESKVNGFGFRYGKFIQALRSSFSEARNITRIKGKVTDLITNDKGKVLGVQYSDPETKNNHKDIKAKLTIVCQGSTSRLRSVLSSSEPKINGFMLGLILEDCDLPYQNHGHVIMANPGPVLTYPVGAGKIRVLIDFPKSLKIKKNEEIAIFLNDVIGPQMPEVLRESFYKSVSAGNFKTRPTVTLSAKPNINKGAILLGDTLNMRHPVTGAGMTVAFSDVKILGNQILKLESLDNEQKTEKALKHFYKIRKKENATLNILAFALYQIFLHPALRNACFNYLKKGGNFSLEPMSILSGISRSYNLLLKHFFAVSWLGVSDTFKSGSLRQAFIVLKDTMKIITPLVFTELPLRIGGKAYKE